VTPAARAQDVLGASRRSCRRSWAASSAIASRGGSCLRHRPALAVGTIALLVATHHVGLLTLVTMSAIFGAADAFFGPASMSMVPKLLPSDLSCRATG
jgi:hypothetical protein